MKTKLEMAHEVAVAMQSQEPITDMKLLSALAWAYADAMQAEAEKRLSEATCKEEWQPDWSQAPEWAEYWTADELATLWWSIEPKFDSSESWHGGPTADIEKAPTFNYQGNWRDSLRKRPN